MSEVPSPSATFPDLDEYSDSELCPNLISDCDSSDDEEATVYRVVAASLLGTPSYSTTKRKSQYSITATSSRISA